MLAEAYLKWVRLFTKFHLAYCWESKIYDLPLRKIKETHGCFAAK